jgi:hypothetical protein
VEIPMVERSAETLRLLEISLCYISSSRRWIDELRTARIASPKGLDTKTLEFEWVEVTHPSFFSRSGEESARRNLLRININ